MRWSRLLLSLALICVLSACSGSYLHDLNFNPNEPIRVAVLALNGYGDEDHSLAVDRIALVSEELSAAPEKIVAGYVQRELLDSGVDLVPAGYAAVQLDHGGYLRQRESRYTPAFFELLRRGEAASTAEICRVLACDAVLFVKVIRWERSYYAVQSVSSVEIELSLVRTGDGARIFWARSSDSTGRGLSKIPTGFSSIVIEPVRGLDNEVILELARKVVHKSLAPLRVRERADYLRQPPPAIIAAAHDSLDLAITGNEALTVIIQGSSGKRATFSIGEYLRDIPMHEVSPGHYVGEYRPYAGERFSAAIKVRLEDQAGRRTEKRLGHESLSFAG